MSDEELLWVDNLRYLGVHFISGKSVKIDIGPIPRKFYASANAVLCRTKYVSDFTKLHLFESFTLPVLTYGLDVLFTARCT